MAVFKNEWSYLDYDEVRSLWVIGEVNGVLFVTSHGQNAVLEIIKAKAGSAPEIKDGKIIMHIEVRKNMSRFRTDHC